MSTVLKMEHIEKVYGNQVRALTDINLEVSEGEFVAIIGPSGSGKSTLLRTITSWWCPAAARCISTARRSLARRVKSCGCCGVRSG